MPEADLPRDLWGVCLSGQDIEPHLACLSVAERRRASGIRHPRARRHFVLGRSALRGLLGSQFALAPKDVCLRVGDDGAVRCDVPGWHCSIAHSNARVIAAVARRPIGIDIELIKPRAPGIAGYLLRPDERESFDALPLDQTRAIILYWTLKEAAPKGHVYRLAPVSEGLPIGGQHGRAHGDRPDHKTACRTESCVRGRGRVLRLRRMGRGG